MQELAETLPVGLFDFDPEPAFNVAPTQKLAAVRAAPDAGKNKLVPLKWGLIPSWSKDPKIATSCINARAETVAEKPAYRSAFKKRRCLILGDGDYESTGKLGRSPPGTTDSATTGRTHLPRRGTIGSRRRATRSEECYGALFPSCFGCMSLLQTIASCLPSGEYAPERLLRAGSWPGSRSGSSLVAGSSV